MPRPKKLTEHELADLIMREVHESEGGEYGTSALMQNRRQAWAYYLGRPRGDEDPDKSQLQSLDVADQIEHLLASMMAAFTTDSPAEFEPEGPQDDSQVELESAGVNHIIMELNVGYEVLYTAIKNALLFKNGIIKVYVSESEDRETMTLDGLSGEDQAILEAASPDDTQIDVDGDSMTLSLAEQVKQIKVEPVEPANFGITANWHKQDLQDCPTVYERKFHTRSELIGMGFPRGKVEELPPFTIDTKTDSLAKHLDESSGPMHRQSKANDLIEVFEVYTMLPRGMTPKSLESERWRVFVSNRRVLEKERVDIVPYASGTPFIVPHRWSGLSLFDKLATVQDSKTAGVRQFADNMSHVNNARLFIQGDVNREELANGAPGHHVTGSINSALTPIPITDIGASALSFLTYMDKIRAERGGGAIDMASPESQLISSQIGATGIALVMGSQEMMAGFMTRTLSETLVRRLFLLVHRVAREQWRQPMTLRKADQFIEVNPSTWPPRKRVNVKTGLSPGERARKVAKLQEVMQTQMALMQSKPTMVTDRNLYRAVMNWAKAAELDNPEQYFLHYESEESQQIGQQAGQAQQQQQQLALQVETLSEQVKLQIAELDDKRERDIAILQAEVEEMKVVGAATGALELEQLRTRAADSSGGSDGATGGDEPSGAPGRSNVPAADGN